MLSVTCAFGNVYLYFYTDTQRISLYADDVTVRNLGRIFAVSSEYDYVMARPHDGCKCISR